jgi:hypothetical protein
LGTKPNTFYFMQSWEFPHLEYTLNSNCLVFWQLIWYWQPKTSHSLGYVRFTLMNCVDNWWWASLIGPITKACDGNFKFVHSQNRHTAIFLLANVSFFLPNALYIFQISAVFINKVLQSFVNLYALDG